MAIKVTQQSIYAAGMSDPNPKLLGQCLEVLGTNKPELQVSQFNIDVAGSISGDLHLGRLYLEVLQEATGAIEVSASNILVLTAYDGTARLVESNLELDSEVDVIHTTLTPRVTSDITINSVVQSSILKDQFLVGMWLEINSIATYVGPISVAANSLLQLTATTYQPVIILSDCGSNLEFTQTIARHGTLNVSVTDELQFETYGDLTKKIRWAASTVEFVTHAEVVKIKVVGNVLELEQSARKDLFFESVESELDLSHNNWINPITIGPGQRDRIPLPAQEVAIDQTVRTNIQSYALTSNIDIITPTTVIGPYYVSAISITQWTEAEYNDEGELEVTLLGLQDSATVATTPGRRASTHVGLEQLAHKVRLKASAISLSASNTLELAAGVPAIAYLDVVSDLDLNTSADTKGAFSENSVEFSSVVTYNTVFAPRLASNELDIISSFFAVPQHFSLCTYSPFTGSTTDPAAPKNILNNQPVIDPARRGVTLFYPWSAPTTTLNLRGPDLGNRNRLEFQRINRETRGGTLVIWADPMWPKNERLVLNFSGLTESEGQSALAFIAQSLGKEIGFTDWEGNTVYGVIMTPSEPLVRDGRKSLSLGFEIEISHTVIVGDCTSSLTFDNAATFNRNRDYSIESAIDLGAVLDYN
jgi:hypothetical protein